MGCPEGSLTAELYKGLLYDVGGFFISHRDTEKSDRMVGTLVIVLPSLHRGGELIVRHAGREVPLNLAPNDVSEVAWAAFYADCAHEVQPIIEGNRLCLIYNLIQRLGDRALQAPDYESEIAEAATLLADWANRPDSAPKFAFVLDHQYSPAGLRFSLLKNGDAATVKVLAAAAARSGCAIHLGIVHIEETGSAEPNYDDRRYSRGHYDDDEASSSDDFEIIDIDDSTQTIAEWVDLDDNPVDFGKLPLMDGELLPAGALDDEEPDEQSLTEATGNEGASFERSYRRAVAVLWSEQRYPEVLLQAGVAATIPYLKKQIDAWSAQAPSNRAETWPKVEALANLILEAWEAKVEHEKSYRHPEGQAERTIEMLNLLRSTGNAGLVARMIGKIVVFTYEGAENEALAAAVPLLNRKLATDIFSRLVAGAMPLMSPCCVDLFKRLAASAPNADQETGPALRTIAEAIVHGLSKMPPANEAVMRFGWAEARRLKTFDAHAAAGLFSVLWQMQAPDLADAATMALISHPEIVAPDTVLVPALALLRKQHGDAAGTPAFFELWRHCTGFLLARSEFPPSQPTDWAQPAKLDCGCADCAELKRFAEDPQSQIYRFRMRQDRRSHVEAIIQRHGLDIACKTDEKGNPKTLVCTKTRRSYEMLCTRYSRDIGHLMICVAVSGNLPAECAELLETVKAAMGRAKG